MCLTPSDYIQFSGFLMFRKNRMHAKGGGIILLIRKNLAYSEIKNIHTPNTNVEICGISITNVSPPMDIITCYRTPSLTLSQGQWDCILDNVNTNHSSLLLGDFNAHNITWNCRKADKNGKLYNSIEPRDLFIHNDHTLTHVNTSNNTKSNIDLVLSTLDISDKINVQVRDETWGSEHYPIDVNVLIEKSYYEKKSVKLSSTRTDWLKFDNFLDLNYCKFLYDDYENSSPDTKYNFFSSTIAEAVKHSTPRKKNNSTKLKERNPVLWWEEECAKVFRLNALLKKNGISRVTLMT